MRNTNIILKLLLTALMLAAGTAVAQAQKWSVSTNVMSWANLGTINAEASRSISKHLSVNAGFAVNPWEIVSPTNVQVMNRQYGGYAGVRYWPWHVYSGWWIGTKVQYKNFEQVGLLSRDPMKGDALGAGLSGGYSMMISERINLDFGLGFWGGRLIRYNRGPRNFIFADNVMVSLTYIF